MAEYKGSLTLNGKTVFHGPIRITTTPVPSPEFPTLSGSFLLESRPDFEPGAQFRLKLEDGREANVFIQDAPTINESLYLVIFYFQSDLV